MAWRMELRKAGKKAGTLNRAVGKALLKNDLRYRFQMGQPGGGG